MVCDHAAVNDVTPASPAGLTVEPLLLVEDDPQLSELLVELLTEAGYMVDLARDGQAGLHLALTRDYAVFVVDRGLPAIEGVDLKIVVIEKNPPIDTPLRDIATEVGHANPGSTVLAISPWFAGTYSTTFDRVTLEGGQDVAKTGDPVQSSKNFASELTTPHFPWTPFTIVLVLGVVVAVVATRILQVRGKRTAAADTMPDSAD